MRKFCARLCGTSNYFGKGFFSHFAALGLLYLTSINVGIDYFEVPQRYLKSI